MSIERLTGAIKRAGAGITEARVVSLADMSRLFDAPLPSTMRRIVRGWPVEGVELGGHPVRAVKIEGRLSLVIDPPVRRETATAPSYHQLGWVRD